jgi:hypothetical protein
MSRHLVVLLAVAAAACGGSSAAPSGTGSTPAAVRAYNATAQQLTDAGASYGATSQQETTVAQCQTDHGTYQARVQPMIDQMRNLGPQMDEMMDAENHPEDADIGCGADATQWLLDQYGSQACASTDMSVNHQRAEQHAQLMIDWAQHQTVRSAQLGSLMGMDMGGMTGMGGSTGTCQRNPDGSFTLSGGGMMGPGGGMQ